MRREGRKGKYGGGDEPIVVPRNAHDGERGVLFSARDLFGNLKMMELRRCRASQRLWGGINNARCTAAPLRPPFHH